MDKSDLELFKQAISEGLSQKFDSVVDNYTEKIVCSERHELAMKTIVYGKADVKRAWSPKMKRIIAILVVAALLLTSCAIIFHNEICEVFEEFFASITFSESESNSDTIEELYELTYLPEGYNLTNKKVRSLRIQWEYTNENNDTIQFEQRVFERTSFTIDSESGYSQMKEIEEWDVYYRSTDKYHNYIWNDGEYIFQIKSNQKISNEEIILIIQGII